MKTCRVALLVILAVFSVAANAGEVWWGWAGQSPTGGNGEWGTARNWGSGVLPGAADSACINQNGDPYPTLSSGSYGVTNTLIGYWGNGGMMMTGGSLGVSNLFAVGYEGGVWNGPASNAVFTMNDGLIGDLSNTNNDPGQLWVGYSNFASYKTNGTMNMNGGRVDVRWNINVGGGAGNTVGHLNLDGGQIHLWQTLNIAAGSNLDLGGGTLSIWNKDGGKTRAEIEAMITGGLITGNGIVGNVKITEFDNLQNDGKNGFALTVLPEPATMVLLGIGGLGLIRRRK